MISSSEDGDIVELYDGAGEFLVMRPVTTSSIVINDPKITKKPASIPNMANFMLVPAPSATTGKSYHLRLYHKYNEAPHARKAYYLGFHGGSQTNNAPAFVDIPKRPTRTTMVFTVEFSGCSFVVIKLNDTHYRAFHDTRTNSSELYDNVVAAIDFREYKGGSGNLATICMHYNAMAGIWKLYAQLLTSTNPSLKIFGFRTPNYDERIITKAINPDILPIQRTIDEAIATSNERREHIRNQLADIARQYEREGLADALNAQDGEFDNSATIPLLSSPAVHSTQTLSRYFNGIKEALRLVINSQGLGDGDPDNPNSVRNSTKRMVKSIEALTDECKDQDFQHLWLLIKNANGIQAVIRTENVLRAPLEGDTIGEKFDMLAARLEVTSNTAATEGYETYTEVKLDCVSANATSLEMKSIFVNSIRTLEDKKLGALLHRIQITADKERANRIWKRTDEVVKYLLEETNHKVKPMPQDVMANFHGDNSSGHCYSLVRAVAVALYIDGGGFAVDQIMAKIVSLRKTTVETSMDARLFLEGLEEIRLNQDAVASTSTRRVTLAEAVDALVIKLGTASQLYSLNTQAHAMLLGATVKDAKISYHFYDPNFALATFDTKETLLKGLTHHLIDEGFGATYFAFITRDAPKFNLVEIDGGKTSQANIGLSLVVQDLTSDTSLSEIAFTRTRLDFDAAARELDDNPDFKKAFLAAEEKRGSSWTSPWVWSGSSRMRIPADVFWGMYAPEN